MVESLDAELTQLTREQETGENGTTELEKLEEKTTTDQETTLTQTAIEGTVQDVENTSQDSVSKESVPESNETEVVPQEEKESPNENEENSQNIQVEKILKGILKRPTIYSRKQKKISLNPPMKVSSSGRKIRPTPPTKVSSTSNKHVGFITNVEFIPFDETKDFTDDIEFVKELRKTVKSYRELFLQMKEEKERQEREEQETEEEDEEEEIENKNNESESKNIVINDQREDKTEDSTSAENQNLDQKLTANENTLLVPLPITDNTIQNETNYMEEPSNHSNEGSSPNENHERQDLQQGLVICEENNKQQVINEIKIYKEKNCYTNEINRAQEENDTSVMNM